MGILLPYGLRKGTLVHIDDIEDKGLNCECRCPYCDATLVAKKGTVNKPHFAHHNAPECKYGFETALHYAAKEIIASRMKFTIPELTNKPIPADITTPPELLLINLPPSVSLVTQKTYDVEKVYLEKQVDSFIPDLIVEIFGQKLIIEIAVTHFVDSDKLNKIKESMIPAIEIDLSTYEGHDITLLEDILILGTERKKWLFNCKANEKWEVWKLEKQIENRTANEKYQEKVRIETEKREQQQKDEEQRKADYKTFLLQHLKPILEKNYNKIDNETAEVIAKTHFLVLNCPEKKRMYNNEYYANVNLDCCNCRYFRGLKNNDNDVCCLGHYFLEKGARKPNNT